MKYLILSGGVEEGKPLQFPDEANELNLLFQML